MSTIVTRAGKGDPSGTTSTTFSFGNGGSATNGLAIKVFITKLS